MNEKQKSFRIVLSSIVGAKEDAEIAYQKEISRQRQIAEEIECVNGQIAGLRVERDNHYKIGQPMLAIPTEIEISKLEAGRATLGVEMAGIEMNMRRYDANIAGLHMDLYIALSENNLGTEIINIRNADDPINEAKKFFNKAFI
ncbi:MAG: hypothetical protein RBS56_03310 [Candidatus Gracilibacteria bacterium]|jgi:hypothetical protein|nr:hypothetical protein [Candidatus Gracilibacteria bacterium]